MRDLGKPLASSSFDKESKKTKKRATSVGASDALSSGAASKKKIKRATDRATSIGASDALIYKK